MSTQKFEQNKLHIRKYIDEIELERHEEEKLIKNLFTKLKSR